MRKKRTYLLLMVMILAGMLMISCGADEPEEEQTSRKRREDKSSESVVTETPTPTEIETVPEPEPEPEQEPEPEAELTGREIFTNVSSDVFREVENKLNSGSYYGFMGCIFSDPRDIYWDEVFYDGAGFDMGYPSAKIKNAYLKESGEDEIYTDLTVIAGDDVRAFVKETTGYEYSDMNNPLTFVYLKGYDLYINQHGDTNRFSVELTDVHYENGEYIATYDHLDESRCITFVDDNGKYRFISNLPKWFVIDPTGGGDIDQSMITDGMILPDSDWRKLSEDELEGLNAKELRIARNEIYARHGRMFNDKELQSYFDQMEWYYPMYEASEFDEGILNEYELYNLELIKQFEKKITE